jgi:hypothetical protein
MLLSSVSCPSSYSVACSLLSLVSSYCHPFVGEREPSIRQITALQVLLHLARVPQIVRFGLIRTEMLGMPSEKASLIRKQTRVPCEISNPAG